MINMLNMDCMDFMARTPDNFYELAIVDPPYGIGINKQSGFGTFKSDKKWDSNIPDKIYFNELFRVSKNQIIWGCNYFLEYLKKTPCIIAWDKMNGTNDLADFETAWASFESPCRMFRMHHFSAGNEKKIHTCQKPVALYKWLLSRYAKPGDKILDTHGGSGSICIACHDLGFDLDWIELDADYYEAACKRYAEHASQGTLFEPKELQRIDRQLEL
jgi:site-specific DNA-methyltransferase (adenine-specific)